MKYKRFISSNQHFIYILFVVVLVINVCTEICSCASGDLIKYRISRKYIQSISDIKYEDISDIKKAFRTDGYYAREEKDNSIAEGNEYIIIFYNDGTFSQHLINSPKEYDDSVEIDNYIYKSNILFNPGEYYGVYCISSDTICVNEYRKDLFAGFEMYKMKFYIIDNETLQYCYFEDPQQVYKGETIKWDRNDIYVFKPAKLPKLCRDRFIKKKKWIWKRLEDWERFIQKQNGISAQGQM